MENIVNYEGELTQKIVGSCMDNIEKNISNVAIMANISTIVIEMCQNMMNYSKTKDINCTDIKSAGFISVQRDEDGKYLIISKNIVSTKDKEKIEPKVIEVQSLDKAGIRKRYKELRRSGKNTHAKGGGIGTYEIAKICDEIEYDFEQINSDKYYYTMQSIIKPKAKKEKLLKEVKTILVADDSIIAQKQIKDLLDNSNYNIELVSCTDQALEIIEEKSIDLMILDTNINGENSIEFLKENSKIVNLFKVPVFIVSENITPDIVRYGLYNGAKDILAKPYIKEELISKVNTWISHRTKELEKKETLKLLNEYKNAVDESSIVTKTNIKGIITYVNKQFCNLSGYTKDELIGKHHNIVRHSDVSSSIYEDMWHTIKDLKKPWRGEIKNKRKDGTHYWVKSFVKPILDIDNNIVEYIAIRVDITEFKDSQK